MYNSHFDKFRSLIGPILKDYMNNNKLLYSAQLDYFKDWEIDFNDRIFKLYEITNEQLKDGTDFDSELINFKLILVAAGREYDEIRDPDYMLTAIRRRYFKLIKYASQIRCTDCSLIEREKVEIVENETKKDMYIGSLDKDAKKVGIYDDLYIYYEAKRYSSMKDCDITFITDDFKELKDKKFMLSEIENFKNDTKHKIDFKQTINIPGIKEIVINQLLCSGRCQVVNNDFIEEKINDIINDGIKFIKENEVTIIKKLRVVKILCSTSLLIDIIEEFENMGFTDDIEISTKIVNNNFEINASLTLADLERICNIQYVLVNGAYTINDISFDYTDCITLPDEVDFNQYCNDTISILQMFKKL